MKLRVAMLFLLLSVLQLAARQWQSGKFKDAEIWSSGGPCEAGVN